MLFFLYFLLSNLFVDSDPTEQTDLQKTHINTVRQDPSVTDGILAIVSFALLGVTDKGITAPFVSLG